MDPDPGANRMRILIRNTSYLVYVPVPGIKYDKCLFWNRPVVHGASGDDGASGSTPPHHSGQGQVHQVHPAVLQGQSSAQVRELQYFMIFFV
jgi:hypothetical protein